MLKGVPKVVSPELLKVLSEMGHGDEIVLADSNYPAASNANLLVRADGVSMPELLDARAYAQRHRRAVGPRAGKLPVRAAEGHARALERAALAELVWDAEGVADCEPVDARAHVVPVV